MERRRGAKREKRRATCELKIAGQPASGILIDISDSGLFVQTNAMATPGTEVAVRILGNAGAPDQHFDTVVARVKRVPSELLSVAPGGLGLKIVRSKSVGANGVRAAARAVAEPEPPPVPKRRFRVRLGQNGGRRSRLVDVDSHDEAAARRAALALAGPGWEATEVRAL
jgi:hypothetical protein